MEFPDFSQCIMETRFNVCFFFVIGLNRTQGASNFFLTLEAISMNAGDVRRRRGLLPQIYS